MAEYIGSPDQRLHHFFNVSPWITDPLDRLLVEHTHLLCRGLLIIDDTALPRSSEHSVGVAHQDCGALRKLANCQSLVMLTLAGGRIFAPLSVRLFLPQKLDGGFKTLR